MFEQEFWTAFWSQKQLNNHLPHITLHVKLVSVTKGLLLHSENCISTFESLNVPLYIYIYREREREYVQFQISANTSNPVSYSQKADNAHPVLGFTGCPLSEHRCHKGYVSNKVYIPPELENYCPDSLSF